MLAADTTNVIWLPDIVVSARRVPAESVDIIMSKYRLPQGQYSLIRSMGGFAILIVSGIFALIWIILIVSRVSEWPSEPRIPKEKPSFHLHELFEKQPVEVVVKKTQPKSTRPRMY